MTILFKMVILFISSLTAQESEDLRNYELCLREVQKEYRFYKTMIPHQFFPWDRKLKRMADGIPFLEENLRVLVKKYQSQQLSSTDRHLIANAVEGCRAFQKKFVTRARSLFAVILLALASLIALTVRAVFNILAPEIRSRKRSKVEDVSRPNNLSQSSHSSQP